MNLKRITLVNWSLFEPIDIDLHGSAAFVGENGAGKSSLLDAIQVVLFGANQNRISLNAATTDGKINNDRSIKAYCQGAYSVDSSDDKEGTASRKRDDTFSYLALSFEHPDRGFVNLIVGIEVRASEPNIKTPILLVMRAPRSASIDDFGVLDGYGNYQTFNTQEVMTALRLYKKGEQQIVTLDEGKNATDYVRLVSNALSPTGLGKQIDPTRLATILSKSMRLKSLSNVSTFVRDFILSPSALETERIRNQQAHYKQILTEIENIKSQLDLLGSLSTKAMGIVKGQKTISSLEWISYEKQFDDLIGKHDEISTSCSDKKEVKKNKEDDLVEAKHKAEEIQQAIIDLKRQIQDNDANRESVRLDSEKSDIDEKCVTNKDNEANLLTMLRKINADDYEQLGLNRPFELSKIIQQSVSNIATRFAADKPFKELLSLHNEIETAASSKFTQFTLKHEEHQGLYKQYQEIIQNPSALSPLKQTTKNLIAVLAHERIEAVPLCHVATITDQEWQPAIEALIGGDAEALVVSIEDEEKAYRIYRKIKREGSVSGVNIIKAKRISEVHIGDIRGTAAEFVESDNELALRYLQYKLQRHKRVATELELKQERFALTKDGMVSNDTSVKPLRFNDLVKFTQDQTSNISQLAKMAESEEKQSNHYAGLLDQIKAIQNFFVLAISLQNNQNFHSFAYYQQIDEGYQTRLNEIEELKSNLDLHYVSSLENQILKHEEKIEPYQGIIETYPEAIGGLKNQIATEEQQLIDNESLQEDVKQVQSDVEQQFFYDVEFTDLVQVKYEEYSVEDLTDLIAKKREKTISDYSEYVTNLSNSLGMMDNFSSIRNFEFKSSEQLPEFNTLLENEITQLKSNELTQYEDNAQQAQQDIVVMFREDIIANLQGKFDDMKFEIDKLNAQLRDKELHGQTYSLKYNPEPGYKDLVKYIKDSRKQETDFVNDLFDNISEDVLAIINEMIETGDGNDYRQYFNYEFVMTDLKTGKRSDLSKRLKSGSGGERQSPLYIAISASLSSAWHSSKDSDGGAIALLDEAFKDLDSANLNSAIQFMKDVGLQMIFAAPEDKEFTFRDSGVDTIIYLTKDLDVIDVDVDIIGDKAKQLSEQNPLVNQELMRNLVKTELAKLGANHVA